MTLYADRQDPDQTGRLRMPRLGYRCRDVRRKHIFSRGMARL